MNPAHTQAFNPDLDLVFERVVDVPRELVWLAWTTPEHLKKWFTPTPWTTTECEIDLRPGGIFRTVMRSPEGKEFPNLGTYLEVVENERLIWTNVLAPGYRPIAKNPSKKECDELPFTAIVSLAKHGSGTKYTAIAMHMDQVTRQKHIDMGFHEGWGKAFDQLVALAPTIKR
jgi:uncharacterized protein YndB with AHSA1/START domain